MHYTVRVYFNHKHELPTLSVPRPNLVIYCSNLTKSPKQQGNEVYKPGATQYSNACLLVEGCVIMPAFIQTFVVSLFFLFSLMLKIDARYTKKGFSDQMGLCDVLGVKMDCQIFS